MSIGKLMYFVFILLLLVGLDIFINGVSLLATSKEYDLMSYFIYDEPYYGFRLWNLSSAPRWLSVVMGGVYIVFGLYLIASQISAIKNHIKFRSHNKR